eukprot:1615301-Rhodomonas_salina.1
MCLKSRRHSWMRARAGDGEKSAEAVRGLARVEFRREGMRLDIGRPRLCGSWGWLRPPARENTAQ